ncbi:MAG: sodium:solute symporter [Bacteroidales bacterium]|nr:sodium:solute symporter [Bacteroidales bacterium]
MSPGVVIVTVVAYLLFMFLVAWMAGKGSDNSAFFSGSRKSRWYIAALAMIGAPMSGVTFVSVPGMVSSSGFGYIQMCLGFVAGYLVISYVLIPLFYKLDVVSIYQYLENRFGAASYKTGAWFFFISKMLGASVRFFLVCLTLQLLVFSPLGLPFWLNVLLSVLVVFAYTFTGGVKTVIWTDALRTLCMILAVVLGIVFIARNLGFDFKGLVGSVNGSSMSRVFFFDDVKEAQFFWKQFLGGLFTAVAMTGLDQDMMQRPLSCKDPKDSRKNMISSGLLQVVVVFLFLCLGVLLYQFASANGIGETGDKIFAAVASSGLLPGIVGILFIIGLVASAYGAGGSALTSLTTSFTVDILGGMKKDEASLTRTRKMVHVGMAVLMAVVIIVFDKLSNTSAINAVYTLASYTYGPILGMFAFGLICKSEVKDKYVPVVAVLAPLLCLVLQLNSGRWFGGYKFSYEILLLNAVFVFLGLCCLIRKKNRNIQN